LKERLKALYVQYGVAAIVTWYGLFLVVLAGFVIAFEYTGGPGSDAGGWVAAYVATEATKPIRIFVALALTPFVAQIGRRLRGTKVPADTSAKDQTSSVTP
jgi:hypothetical protein